MPPEEDPDELTLDEPEEELDGDESEHPDVAIDE
jgi:hypothetical protein